MGYYYNFVFRVSKNLSSFFPCWGQFLSLPRIEQLTLVLWVTNVGESIRILCCPNDLRTLPGSSTHKYLLLLKKNRVGQ